MQAAPSIAAGELDARARAHMKRGMALLEENTPGGLREAVCCFDAAIELRRQLPLAENCWFRYGLIAGWLNRGDAFTRLGSADDLAEALRCYDEAFVHLRELPMRESPLFIKRLAIAWLNRGFTLMKQPTPASVAAAAESFREAVAAAKNFFASTPADGRALLAAAWMNRGNALIQLTPPNAHDANAAAAESLKLCAAAERDQASLAEIGFKARHILCQALAQLLAGWHLQPGQRDELLAAATDAVDDGMALARHWEAHGQKQFGSLAAALFRFGCRVYQTHQPHFLSEFLLENLDPARSDGAFAGSQSMHASAFESLWRALGESQREGFKTFSKPRFNEMLERLHELRVTEERLATLRRAVVGGLIHR